MRDQHAFVFPYFHFPPNADTTRCELLRFAEMKDTMSDLNGVRDEAKVSEWAKATAAVVRQDEDRFGVMGWSRRPPPPNRLLTDSELVEEYFLPMVRTCKSSSTGIWARELKMPKVPGERITKADVLEEWLNNPEFDAMPLLRCSHDVFLWMSEREGNTKIPLYVYGKDEPVKFKKLLSGQHRTIQMPDWAFVILETRLSSYASKTTDDVCFYDDLISQLRMTPRVTPNGSSKLDGRMVGSDVVKECPNISTKMKRVYDYDVTGWDRTLPRQVTDAYYCTYFEPCGRVFALNAARALTGEGAYITPTGHMTFGGGINAWTSGALKTLSGNCTIHIALFDALFTSPCDLPLIVMGDDGNIAADGLKTRDGRAILNGDDLRVVFGTVGLKLKQADLVEGNNFCKVRSKLVGDCYEARMNTDDILAKFSTLRGAECADTLGQLVLRSLQRTFRSSTTT